MDYKNGHQVEGQSGGSVMRGIIRIAKTVRKPQGHWMPYARMLKRQSRVSSLSVGGRDADSVSALCVPKGRIPLLAVAVVQNPQDCLSRDVECRYEDHYPHQGNQQDSQNPYETWCHMNRPS